VRFGFSWLVLFLFLKEYIYGGSSEYITFVDCQVCCYFRRWCV